MCKNVVLIIAPSMNKKEETSYQKLIRDKILDGENGKKLIFVHGQNLPNLAHGLVVKKVVADLMDSQNEGEIIASVKKSVIKTNKQHVPVYLRISQSNDMGSVKFGYITINSFKMVKHFNPIEIPCPAMEMVAESM